MDKRNCKQILISVVIVLYNLDLEKSEAFLSVMRYKKKCVEIIVCDNSDKRNDNKKKSEKYPVRYIQMGGNKGLPKAYNLAIANSKGNNICILDDDTKISSDYFDKMISYIQKYPSAVIAPIVMTGNSIFSPVLVNGFRYKSFKNLNMNPKRISAINSGLIIPAVIFDYCKYNEKIFIDCADHDFIRQIKAKNIDIVIAKDVVLQQNYSRLTDGKEQMLKRLNIFYKDSRVFCSDSIVHRIYCCFDILFTKIKYAIKYKSLDFFNEISASK